MIRHGLHQERRPVSRPPRRIDGRFLLGPVPMLWLEAAALLKGSALAVGLQLWHRAGVKNDMEVRFSASAMQLFGVSRFSASRSLKKLERAGLVNVVSSPGRAAVVTILFPDRESSR